MIESHIAEVPFYARKNLLGVVAFEYYILDKDMLLSAIVVEGIYHDNTLDVQLKNFYVPVLSSANYPI